MNNMSEELLKQDPLAKPKKITIGVFVGVMAVIMVVVFASMHWILSDYFLYKANETEAQSRLNSVREMCKSEEEDAKNRIAEAEAKSKAAEDSAIARAEAVEKSAAERASAAEEQSKRRIAEAEAQSKQRIEALDSEYSGKRKTKEQEYESLSKELKVGYEKQKENLDILRNGYEDHFAVTTNDLAEKISVEQKRLDVLKHQISLLPDLSAQCTAASNDLVRARKDRDDALERALAAQREYNAWQGKAGESKAEAEQWKAKKAGVEKEILDLSSRTNSAVIAITGLEATKVGVESQIVQKRSELEGVNAELKAARANLSSINDEIKRLGARQKQAKEAYDSAVKDRDQALEEKRKAESGRDKAVAERLQAEQNRDDASKAYEKRKVEVDGLIKGLDEVLKLKSKQVQSAAQDQAVTKDTANWGNNK